MTKQINYLRENTAKQVNYDHDERVAGIRRYDRCNMPPFSQIWRHLCKSNRNNCNSATLMTNFDKDINGHAIVKIVLITKLQMYVLAQKHYKVSLLLLILII